MYILVVRLSGLMVKSRRLLMKIPTLQQTAHMWAVGRTLIRHNSCEVLTLLGSLHAVLSVENTLDSGSYES